MTGDGTMLKAISIPMLREIGQILKLSQMKVLLRFPAKPLIREGTTRSMKTLSRSFLVHQVCIL